VRALKVGRPNVDFGRWVYDECDLRAVSEESEHTTCLWPAIKDAAVRRPPYPLRRHA